MSDATPHKGRRASGASFHDLRRAFAYPLQPDLLKIEQIDALEARRGS